MRSNGFLLADPTGTFRLDGAGIVPDPSLDFSGAVFGGQQLPLVVEELRHGVDVGGLQLGSVRQLAALGHLSHSRFLLQI